MILGLLLACSRPVDPRQPLQDLGAELSAPAPLQQTWIAVLPGSR